MHPDLNLDIYKTQKYDIFLNYQNGYYPSAEGKCPIKCNFNSHSGQLQPSWLFVWDEKWKNK